jgi:hypothetical protein
LQRALTGVWLGAHLRAELWSDADAITALQGWTLNTLFDLDYVYDQTEAPYHVFDGSLSSKWQSNFLLKAKMKHSTDTSKECTIL